jgi:tetratricopeptide (TPR) repeat protein
MDENLFIQKAYEAIIKHDFEQAIIWFEKAIEEDPSNASYHYRLSISYARSNKLGKAVEHAEQACKLSPSTETYLLHLNSVIARQLLYKAEELMRGDAAAGYGEAIFVLRRAIQLNPLLVEAMVMLAIASEKLGQLAEAWAIVQDAIKLDPHHKEVNQLYARLLTKMNRN